MREFARALQSFNGSNPAMKKSQGSESGAPSDADWAALTWSDLERWADSRSVQRGRSYRRDGRVKDLKISSDGELLATVVGTARYVTTVSLGPGRALESVCNCPLGISGCKHAVAVVAEYLQALVDQRAVPVAAEDDPRWDELDDEGAEIDEDWDEDNDNWNEEDEEPPPNARRSSRKRAGAVDWDDKIERHIRAKSRDELADLVCSLVQRFPEIRQEFRERIALQGGDVKTLVAEVRREIKRVTSEIAWRNSWTGEGHMPDYDKIRHRFERLLDLGHADEVVSLGREFIVEGLGQVGEANDGEGETGEAFAKCLPVIFQAVTRSSLSGPERLLFAIDAELADDCDVIGDSIETIIDAPTSPQDWSAVADALSQRLKGSITAGEGFLRDYKRDQLTDWIAEALDEAGRDDELQPLYEAEARITKSYERLVGFLADRELFEDAERWAREGIAATSEKLPGIALGLAESLRKLAEKRERWDEVAAHAAFLFFSDRAGLSTFDDLMKAAKKAGVEEPTRASALRFLETGAMPYQLAPPLKKRGKPQPKTKVKAKTKAEVEPAAPARLKIEPDWPLPVPDYLTSFLERPGRYNPTPGPRLDVLLNMALAAKRPDETLHWFDKMQSAPRGSGFYPSAYGYHYGDRVAEAVSATHPERALAIYTAALNALLPRAELSAYQSATNYLRKLQPLYEALNRADEWNAMVASIREKYRNRPRFMELLDGLDDRPIVQSSRPRRK